MPWIDGYPARTPLSPDCGVNARMFFLMFSDLDCSLIALQRDARLPREDAHHGSMSLVSAAYGRRVGFHASSFAIVGGVLTKSSKFIYFLDLGAI